MKIHRFQEISNHRIFRDFKWDNPLNFTRYNLIYGWNGTGKTTLSRIFQSIQHKTPVSEGTVKIRANGQTFDLTQPNNGLPSVKVFNSELVRKSIYESDELEPIFYIGEKSAQAQAQIEHLSAEQEDVNKSLTATRQKNTQAINQRTRIFQEQAKRIKELLFHTESGKYNYYDKGDFESKVSQLINTGESFELVGESFKEKLELLKVNEIRKIDLPSPPNLNLSHVLAEVEQALASTIMSETIDELENEPKASNWVKAGIELHDERENCLFCGNRLSEHRKEQLNNHFNDNFINFQQKLASLQSQITNTSERLESFNLLESDRFISELQTNYRHKSDEFLRITEFLKAKLSDAAQEIEKKRDNPFIEQEHNAALHKEIHSNVHLLTEVFDKICSIISQHNEAAENLDSRKVSARADIESHIASIATTEIRQLNESINNSRESIAELNKQHTSLANELAVQQRQVAEYAQPAHELTAEVAAFLGRNELSFLPKEEGYEIRRGEHKAKDLSEGEKTAIAFVHFLKTLQDSSFDITSSIVVIDDPISSLDSNSLFSAFSFMIERTEQAEQLFVLTHNFQFFNQTRTWMELKKRKDKSCAEYFMLNTSSNDEMRRSAIEPLNELISNHVSEYHYLFSLVLEHADGNKSLNELFLMPNVARRLLEAFYSFRNPSTGSLSTKILPGFDKTKRQRILRFAHHFSHADIIATEAKDDFSFLAETQEFLQDVLLLIKEEDDRHFEDMKKICIKD